MISCQKKQVQRPAVVYIRRLVMACMVFENTKVLLDGPGKPLVPRLQRDLESTLVLAVRIIYPAFIR